MATPGVLAEESSRIRHALPGCSMIQIELQVDDATSRNGSGVVGLGWMKREDQARNRNTHQGAPQGCTLTASPPGQGLFE